MRRLAALPAGRELNATDDPRGKLRSRDARRLDSICALSVRWRLHFRIWSVQFARSISARRLTARSENISCPSVTRRDIFKQEGASPRMHFRPSARGLSLPNDTKTTTKTSSRFSSFRNLSKPLPKTIAESILETLIYLISPLSSEHSEPTEEQVEMQDRTPQETLEYKFRSIFVSNYAKFLSCVSASTCASAAAGRSGTRLAQDRQPKRDYPFKPVGIFLHWPIRLRLGGSPVLSIGFPRIAQL